MKIIFPINSSEITNFVLEAESKETCSKTPAVLHNLYIYYVVVVLTVRETCWCYVCKIIGPVYKT